MAHGMLNRLLLPLLTTTLGKTIDGYCYLFLRETFSPVHLRYSMSMSMTTSSRSRSNRDVIVLEDDSDDSSGNNIEATFVRTSQSETGGMNAAARGSNATPFFTPFYLYASRSSTLPTASSTSSIDHGGKATKYFRTLRQMIGFDGDDIMTIKRKKRKYQWMIIFNYLIDFPYLMEELMPELLHFHRIIVFYGTSIGIATVQEEEAVLNQWRSVFVGNGNTVEFIKLIPSDPPRSKTNPLPWKIPYGVHHTKMFLMGYHDNDQDFCRVVIHTANLIKSDIEYKTQGAYCQDFPLKDVNSQNQQKELKPCKNNTREVVNPYKKQRIESSNWPMNDEEESCQFEEDLITYLESYRYLTRQSWCTKSSSTSSSNNKFLSDKPMSWLQLLRQYNFSTAYVTLIPSVPGRHNRNVYDNFGYLKLRQAIIKSNYSPFHDQNHKKRTTPLPPILCQISSIGSLNTNWLDQFLSAIDLLSAQSLDPTTNISNSSGKSRNDTRRPLSSRLKIIWPTVEEIRTSIEGYRGGNSVPGSMKNVSKEFLLPLYHRWSVRRYSCSAMKNSKNSDADPLNTARHIPHIKMIIQTSASLDSDDEIEWLVLTSHNLSMAAWGQMQKNNADGNVRVNDEKILFIRHWELGVFLSSSTLLAKGDGYASTDSPSPSNRLRIHPYRGISVSSPEAVINVDNEDDDGNYGNANVLHVPIPFDLKPDPYNEDDTPWACDRSRLIPDAFGCIIP